MSNLGQSAPLCINVVEKATKKTIVIKKDRFNPSLHEKISGAKGEPFPHENFLNRRKDVTKSGIVAPPSAVASLEKKQAQTAGETSQQPENPVSENIMTKNECKAFLDKAGVQYDANANLAALRALVDGAEPQTAGETQPEQ